MRHTRKFFGTGGIEERIDEIRRKYSGTINGIAFSQEMTDLAVETIAKAMESLSSEVDCSSIVIYGYGSVARRQMSLYSDLDLIMFCDESKVSSEQEKLIIKQD